MEYYLAFCVFVAIFCIIEAFYPGYRLSNWSKSRGRLDKIVFWCTIFCICVVVAPLLALSCFMVNKRDLAVVVAKSLDKNHTH